MQTTQRMRELYEQMRKQLFYMIPEKWDKIYLYASVLEIVKDDPVGEMFFYYYPKGLIKKNPINVYEVPSKFNIDEESYLRLAAKLYATIKQLYLECKLNDNKIWTNITIKIENSRFLIEYDYDQIISNEKENYKRRIIWIYENLGFPIEAFNKEEKRCINEYIEYRKISPKNTTTYTEGIYKNERHTHNVVGYGYEDSQKLLIEELGEQRSRELEEELNELSSTQKKPHKRNQILN